jgi:hypothetical protein
MTETITARLSLDEVRASVTRVQSEGRKLVTRLRKDATALVNRPPIEVLEEARKRAAKAVESLDSERQRLRRLVVERLGGLADQVVNRAGLAKAQTVSELERRVRELERRVERAAKAA